MTQKFPMSLSCLVLFLCIGCSVAVDNRSNPPVPVSHVEVDKYLGHWFSVARIPNRFESDCLQSSAEYLPIDDKTIKVINSCPTKTGGHTTVEGKGWILDQSNARLEVGFFSIFGWYPGFARGNYWILGLGPIDDQGLYSYAIVGEPSRKYGWILARTQQLNEGDLNQAFKILKGQGYSPDDFELLS